MSLGLKLSYFFQFPISIVFKRKKVEILMGCQNIVVNSIVIITPIQSAVKDVTIKC
ncbi:MAG: hypothetical protein WAM42_15735 [Candidatus Nitrosopolaris sp.]